MASPQTAVYIRSDDTENESVFSHNDTLEMQREHNQTPALIPSSHLQRERSERKYVWIKYGLKPKGTLEHTVDEVADNSFVCPSSSTMSVIARAYQ